MNREVEIYIPEDKIVRRIQELADEISHDYAGKEITFLITLKGAVFFACELAKRITVPLYLEFIQTASYQGTASTGTVTMKLDVDTSVISGKHIFIIEDIIDTGRTLAKLKTRILSQNPASLKICALLDKTEVRVVELNGDYIGFPVKNEFMVGYGLDVNQRYRNLPFIGIYHPETE